MMGKREGEKVVPNKCITAILEHRFSIQNSVQFLDFGISQKAIFR